MWSVWLIVVLQLFAFSDLLFLIVSSPLSPPSLIAVYLPYLAYGLLLPALSSFSLPTLTTLLRSAGAEYLEKLWDLG